MAVVLAIFLGAVLVGCLFYAIFRWDPHLHQTDAGIALVHNTYEFGERPVRVLAVGHGWQSGIRLDDPYELVFPYVRAFDALFCGPDDVRRVLCIGGGGFSYPRTLASRGIAVDAVERDPRVVAIAERHFGLREAESLTDAEGRPLLRVIVADGMEYLRSNSGEYDAIVIDAYDGMDADPAFASTPAILAIRNHLNPQGVLAVNVATPRENPQTLVTWANRLRETFDFVYIVSCTPGPAYTTRNHIVLASRHRLAFEGDRFGPFPVTRI